MPDILHDFLINASAARVFDAVSTPEHLDQWWTKRSTGQATVGAEFELWFGPQFDWLARVTRCVPAKAFEFEIVRAGEDWTGTRVGVELASDGGATQVGFHHVGWPRLNEHYRVSCYCWAMYLRALKRYLEHGEFVPYEQRRRCDRARSVHTMIRKLPSGDYRLYSRTKNPKADKWRNLGTFPTRAAAEKHERQVEFFKRRGPRRG